MPAHRKPPGVKRDCRHQRADHRHGTRDAYNRDLCRCGPCGDANLAWQRAYRRRRAQMRWSGAPMWVHPVGTHRRLQALAVMGWSLTELGSRLGVSVRAVHQLRNWQGRMLASTAARVERLYAELSDVEPPKCKGSTYARNHATNRGWQPPAAWDDDTIDDPSSALPLPDRGLVDEVAIEEALRGRRVTLSKAEREEAVRRGRARGMTAREMALVLCKPRRSVERDLKAVA